MYSVSIIPPDLRHEEAIIQAANSLEYLQNTITDVFDKIDSRINKNNEKIYELQDRINSANTKIHGLFGQNKAIKIFSPAKFPAPQIFRNIPVTFDEFKGEAYNFKLRADYSVISSQDPCNNRNIQEKLFFYHVRDNSNEKSRLQRVLRQKQGLGPISPNINSINSLLLYNTSENVYEKYSPMDTFSNKEKNRSRQSALNDTQPQKIEAAPFSIINRQLSDKRVNPELFYTPKLNDAPEINVPVDLPDLPGIADDINFNITENEKIAPSLYFENLVDLPEPSSIGTVPRDAISDQNNINQSESISASQPPPPPPPSALIETSKSPQFSTGKQIPAPPTPPPPPPPPPPLVLPPVEPDSGNNLAKPSTAKLPPITDSRSTLMEAIRKAGGAQGGKLRAAADVVKNETSKKPTSIKPAGDLMADLHNKLSMRRKGISGAKDSVGGPSGSGINVAERLSALIPPPSKAQVNSSTDDDDDWAA